MDLSPYQYVDGMHDPLEVVVAILLLALLPFAATLAVALWRRPRDGRWTPAGLLARFPRLRHLTRRAAIVPLVLVGLVALKFDLLVLEELVTLPHGELLALLPIALGVSGGLLVAARPRTRGLRIALVAAGAATVLGALLFSGQFAAPSANAPATPRPTGPGVVLEEPNATRTSAAPSTTSPAPASTPTTAPAPYDPTVAALPTGRHAVAEPVCLAREGSAPVALRVDAAGTVAAQRADGTATIVGDVADLRPCALPTDADPVERFVPAQAITTFGGRPVELTGTVRVRVVAQLTSPGGEDLTWVWRRVDGVVHAGLVRTDQLR